MFFVERIKLCDVLFFKSDVLFFKACFTCDLAVEIACLRTLASGVSGGRDFSFSLGRGLLGSGNMGEGFLRISCPAVCKVFVKRWLKLFDVYFLIKMAVLILKV